LSELSNLENPQPLNPEEIDIEKIRSELEKAGFNLEINEKKREALREAKFRTYHQGKGAAVAKIIGPENVDKLERKLLELSAGGPRIISSETGKPIERTESRGLRQFIAEIFALATEVISKDEFCQQVNTRVWKGLRRRKTDQEKEELDRLFGKTEEPSRKIASIPPGKAVEAYRFLINELITA